MQKNPKSRGQVLVGDILIEAGLVTRQQVDEALSSQSFGKHKRIGSILVERGLITEEQLLSALAHKFGLQVVDLRHAPPNPAAIRRLSREMIEKMQVMPLEMRGTHLVVATSNPTDPIIIQNLRFVTNCPIKLVVGYGSEQFKRDEMPAFSKELTLMRAKGCEACEGQGYSGRIAIHELLVNSVQIKQAIKHTVGVDKIQEIATEQGMATLRMDGIQKIFLGLTDLIQINRVAL